MYFANYPVALYFQIKFIRLICTLHAKNRITNSIGNRRKSSSLRRKYYGNLELQKGYKNRRYKEIPEMKKEYQKKKNEGKKKVYKVEKFYQQIRLESYYFCTVCHRCLYQHSFRLFHDQKYIKF